MEKWEQEKVSNCVINQVEWLGLYSVSLNNFYNERRDRVVIFRTKKIGGILYTGYTIYHYYYTPTTIFLLLLLLCLYYYIPTTIPLLLYSYYYIPTTIVLG